MQIEERYLWVKTSSKSLVCQARPLSLKQGFKRGVVENNIYIKMEKDNLLITLVHVDDLIFGSNNDDMGHGFSQEMSIIGELSFFIGLQVSQIDEGIFIYQTNYLKEMLKHFGMEECEPVSTPVITRWKLRMMNLLKTIQLFTGLWLGVYYTL